MATVQRYNVILQIDDNPDTIQRYLDKGYNIIDERGHVVKEAISSDVGTLQKKVRDLTKQVKELKAQLALYENMQPEVKEEEPIEEEPVEEVKPKRTRQAKKQAKK